MQLKLNVSMNSCPFPSLHVTIVSIALQLVSDGAPTNLSDAHCAKKWDFKPLLQTSVILI